MKVGPGKRFATIGEISQCRSRVSSRYSLTVVVVYIVLPRLVVVVYDLAARTVIIKRVKCTTRRGGSYPKYNLFFTKKKRKSQTADNARVTRLIFFFLFENRVYAVDRLPRSDTI